MYAYNPRKKSYQQLEKSMVGDDKWDILNSILKEMDIKKNEGPKQHWMIIGPRGIGKSHLMTLLYHKVKYNQKLSKKWVPILFPEDLKLAGALHQILERALNEIILETEQKGKKNSITVELKQKIQDVKSVPSSGRTNIFFDLLSWFYHETGKHTLLIAENLQQLLGKKIPVIEQKKLRAFLQTSDALLIIGSATTVFNALHDHSHPFYHFFHIRRLEDLDFEDMKILLLDILSQKQQPGLQSKVTNGNARLKALYSFTGGNPRMAVFLADILSTEVPGEMLELMDSILDELTPYFESILQGIADCFEEVINTLAAFESAQSPSEIAKHLEMPQASIRNYLKQLKEDGYVRIAFSKGKSNYYCLNEYIYRIWFQMRDSSHREESRWLIELLLMLYSRETIADEKNRLELCCDVEQPAFHYKKLIDDAVQYMDRYPEYSKVIEWCVDSLARNDKKETQMQKQELKLKKEAIDSIEKQQYEKTIEKCKKIIEINPGSVVGFGLWGECLKEQKKYEEAIEKFKKVIEINPKIEMAHWSLGVCLREQGRYKEAIEKFKEVININPNAHHAYGAWGDCLKGLGLHEEADKQYKKAIEINQYYEDAYLAWADNLFIQGHYIKAIDKCRELIKINQKSESGHILWGGCLFKQKEYEEATEIFKKAIKVNPESEEAYFLWGYCLRTQKRYEEAIGKFKKVTELNPKSERAYMQWGDCLRLQGRPDEAIKKFKKAIELNPNSAYSYMGWGECLQWQDHYKEAIKKFKKAIELNHSLEDAYGFWGDSLRQLGQNEEAISLIEANVKDSKSCSVVHIYANCLMEAKHYNDALKQFEKLIEIEPGCPSVYWFYGQLMEKRKDKISALSTYLTQIKLLSDGPDSDNDFQEIFNEHIAPLLSKLKPTEYIKQFFEPEKKKPADLKLLSVLVLLNQYDILSDHLPAIFKECPDKEGKEKQEFEVLIFTIKLSAWLKLSDKNLNDALKSTELYIEYIKALKTNKEKENEVLNFSLDLFSVQIKYNIEAGNVQKVLKRMEDEEEIPFSNVIYKIWTCLSEPDSVEAQRYLNEKPIAEVVKQLKARVKSQKGDKKHDTPIRKSRCRD